MQDALPGLLVLPGGDDHAGVRHGDADAGYDLGECIVIDAVVKVIRVDVVRVFEPRHADGVGTYAEGCLQMLRMHEQAGKFIAVFIQAEEHA